MNSYLFIFLWILAHLSQAQTSGTVNVSLSLPSVALLDIEPAGIINLNFTAPTEAGSVLGSIATNNTKWINISSAVSSGLTRNVTVQISGTQPNGVRLKLQTANASTGAGTRGTASSPIFLTSSPQTIVSGIGGSYTNTGSGNGYNLTYSLDIQTYSLLRSGSYTFSVLFTLVDN
ncbi:hypothetical protein [Emticicia sp. SJ17W-69]|uniref:hypothetical protein n=1 Tax=Emticicia sp. SJ17W-69 TaxID=3421657 RepID=UPI003EBA34AD